MDKIEKIRQEIERLKGDVTATIKELRMPEPSERMRGELDAYDDILYFLDSLQQEQKNVKLEDALNSLDDAYFDLGGIAVIGATHYLTVEELKDTARYFYELGKNSK